MFDNVGPHTQLKSMVVIFMAGLKVTENSVPWEAYDK